MDKPLTLITPFEPTGDQPEAITKLATAAKAGYQNQVLLGVTGSGKTFTIAKVIEKLQKPTLIISHNKTLAAQLYQEFRDFFPHNRVEYFVSYYDYYQPEAYVPQRDLYIEKEADINEEIDKLRLSSTTSLLTHTNTIVVASVSCIYNLGSPLEYARSILELQVGMKAEIKDITTLLHNLQYERKDYEFTRSTYRVTGDTLDIYLAYIDEAIRVEFLGQQVSRLKRINPLTAETIELLKRTAIFPAKHYLMAQEKQQQAIQEIEFDLKAQLKALKKDNKQLEAYRLEQRTNYDLELLREFGYCSGIENYSRYFDGRKKGEPPYTLLDFFKQINGGDYLTIIDESHITMPQIRGMYNGDQARKEVLIQFGFRLPSARDNRPLHFNEFLARTPQLIYVSATPALWETTRALQEAKRLKTTSRYVHRGIVEQLIRPTGILDPQIEIRPTANQIPNLIEEIEQSVKQKQRVLVTTLTKRMAEELSKYLDDKEIKSAYLHADVETLNRSDILEDLRRGVYDVLVGINLLREGLDLPEVALVVILDADKEGFLRSTTALVQTMGRAARHVNGKVIMYADKSTKSMTEAINEVERRRAQQQEYNQQNQIIPRSIKKTIKEKIVSAVEELDETIQEGLLTDEAVVQMLPYEKKQVAAKLNKEMKLAAKELRFEEAARIRDEIHKLQ